MSALTGKHALITGGGTGIGRAIALRLSHAGAAVTLMARDAARLEAVAADLPRAQAIGLDLRSDDMVAAAFRQATERFGPAAILVNNAGIAPSAPFGKTDPGLWNEVLAVNLTGVYLSVRAALDDMIAQDFGRIITIASTAGLKGYPYVSAYVAAKHGVIGLTRALALEVAHRNITVNSICPGFADTAIVRNSIETIARKTGRSEQDALDLLVAGNPQKPLIEPDEIAALALWLCSPDARSVTGQALAMAGGEVM